MFCSVSPDTRLSSLPANAPSTVCFVPIFQHRRMAVTGYSLIVPSSALTAETKAELKLYEQANRVAPNSVQQQGVIDTRH